MPKSIRYSRIEDLNDALQSMLVAREAIPYEAAFLAGRAFLLYRKHSGTRRSPLPDFFIGAHASIAAYSLLTRDASRYRTYFLNCPSLHPVEEEDLCTVHVLVPPAKVDIFGLCSYVVASIRPMEPGISERLPHWLLLFSGLVFLPR
jgi:hypothetical protein